MSGRRAQTSTYCERLGRARSIRPLLFSTALCRFVPGLRAAPPILRRDLRMFVSLDYPHCPELCAETLVAAFLSTIVRPPI